MKKYRSAKRFAGLCVALAMGVTACGDSSDSTSSSGAETGDANTEEAQGADSVQLGLSTVGFRQTYMILAADRLGYFEDENLDVDFVEASGSGALLEQMAAGNIALGTPSLASVLEALNAGIDVVNYYTVSSAFNFGIYVPEGSPVQEVADLEGQAVGITEAGGGEVAVLTAALADAGLDAVTDVRQLPIGTGDASTLAAITDGTVAAYAASTSELFGMQVNAGVELRNILPEDYAQLPSRGLITTSEMLEDEPDVLTRVARAIAKATLYCSLDERTCADWAAENAPEYWAENDQGVSVGQLDYDYTSAGTPAGEDLRFGEHDIELYERFKEVSGAAAEASWSLEDFLQDDLLDEINDFDRQAVVSEAGG